LITSILLLNGLSGHTASKNGALTLSGSSKVTAPGAVIVDSTASQAAQTSGSAQLIAPLIKISGGSSGSGFNPPSGANVYTQVTPQTADPLAAIPVPSPTPVISSAPGWTAGSGSTPWKPTSTSGTVSLSPGYYQGGINVSGGTSVTLGSGIYYLGGPLTWNSTGTLDGTAGVMIYVAPGTSSQGITFSSGVFKVSPPASGTYQGIVLFQDRTSSAKVSLSGGSGWSVSGTVYVAKAPLTLSGGSNATVGSSFIAETLNVSGGSFIIAPPTVQTPDPTKHEVILVE
jgi:hypothetical protein